MNCLQLKAEIVSLPTLADRVKFAADKITAACQNLESGDVISAFDLYYKKLLISLTYTPQHKLQKEVTLIKASDSVDMTKTFSDAYDLEKVSCSELFFKVLFATNEDLSGRTLHVTKTFFLKQKAFLFLIYHSLYRMFNF